MKTALPVLLCCLPLMLQAAPLYKWKDANGRVFYSDYPPPVSQPGGVTQLDRQGQVIKKGESAEEIAAREAASKAKQSQQHLQLQQQRNDTLLQERYQSERDVIRDRDKQLAQLEPGLRLLLEQEKKLQGDIGKLRQEVAKAGGTNSRTTEGLQSQLQVQQAMLRENQQQQKIRRAEISTIQQQAELTSQRLRQLKGLTASAPSGKTPAAQ